MFSRSERITILTALEDLRPSYSVSHVVRDQLLCLRMHGHDPLFAARETFPSLFIDLAGGYSQDVEPVFPFDASPESLSSILTDFLSGVSIAITHDWIAHERYVSFAEALKLSADSTRGTRFFHWVHSVPTVRKPWWGLEAYGDNHFLVYPNAVDTAQVARMFRTSPDRIRTCPPITDVRTLLGAESSELWKICGAVPGLHTADFIQVYPVAADRFSHKGLDKLIFLFRELKRLDRSVCLVVVDSWSGRCEREDLEAWKRKAEANGLTEGEIVFVSEISPVFDNGVQRSTVAMLQILSNVFAFPTIGEAMPLIAPEALLMGGGYPLLNADLIMSKELFGGHGHGANFGSHQQKSEEATKKGFYERHARKIVEYADSDERWQTKNYARRHYNLDNVYRQYYAPFLTETEQEI